MIFKHKKVRQVKLAATSFFILLMHLPFVFAKSKGRIFLKDNKMPVVKIETSSLLNLSSVVPTANKIYDSLKLNVLGLSKQAFEYAMKGFNSLTTNGKIVNEKIISIVDFSESSAQKRLFIIDIKNFKLLFNTYVAHGINSGLQYATQFSNVPQSNMSSLGFYRTENTYNGANGYSLKLTGLDRGFNDNASDRDIVIHGAAYVNEEYIKSQGYVGRSWGCPAVAQTISKSIIDKIKSGTCLFIYSPSTYYINHSKILNP